MCATFHDSCNPARAMGLLDEPRVVLRAACPRFFEMAADTIRERTLCCGGGAGLGADENMEVRLRGGMPFTLLAPRGLTTMPTWRWHELLQPSGHASLRALLHRHLIPGRVYLGGSSRELRARNLEGRALQVERESGLTRVGGRKVVAADIEARNGLIHVIEGLLV